MLSIEQIVNDPGFVRQKLADRGETPPIEQIIELDTGRRALVHDGDVLRAKRNDVSRGIGKSAGQPAAVPSAEMRPGGESLQARAPL